MVKECHQFYFGILNMNKKFLLIRFQRGPVIFGCKRKLWIGPTFKVNKRAIYNTKTSKWIIHIYSEAGMINARMWLTSRLWPLTYKPKWIMCGNNQYKTLQEVTCKRMKAETNTHSSMTSKQVIWNFQRPIVCSGNWNFHTIQNHSLQLQFKWNMCLWEWKIYWWEYF